MGAAACFAEPLIATSNQPLVLRYLLHAHAGPSNSATSAAVFERFEKLPAFVVAKATMKHETWSIRRGG
jgi:hypothetical protein